MHVLSLLRCISRAQEKRFAFGRLLTSAGSPRIWTSRWGSANIGNCIGCGGWSGSAGDIRLAFNKSPGWVYDCTDTHTVRRESCEIPLPSYIPRQDPRLGQQAQRGLVCHKACVALLASEIGQQLLNSISETLGTPKRHPMPWIEFMNHQRCRAKLSA